MIREIVSVKDFDRISNEHEFFLWNFINGDDCIKLQSYFKDIEPNRRNQVEPHELREILSNFPNLPYFESYVNESYDFLINLGNEFREKTWSKKTGYYQPVLIAFNRKRVASNTYVHCYCLEGILNVIGELNPQFILDVQI